MSTVVSNRYGSNEMFCQFIQHCTLRVFLPALSKLQETWSDFNIIKHPTHTAAYPVQIVLEQTQTIILLTRILNFLAIQVRRHKIEDKT
jgi:hypothetical protein